MIPKISIILPTYHRAALLPRAIASVLGQSWTDFELIVVDDADRPDDDTAAAVASFKDPRVVYLPPGRNLGDAGARNRGIAVARGEWLAFQDSDDEWLPDKLKVHLDTLASDPDAVLLAAATLRRRGDRATLHQWPALAGSSSRIDIQQWMGTAICNLQGVMVSRQALMDIGGFDTGYKAISDADMIYRLIKRCPGKLAASPLCVALLHDTPGSLINHLGRLTGDLQRLLDMHVSLMREWPSAHAHLSYRLALTRLQAGEIAAARTAALYALRADPSFWRPWAFLPLTLLGASLSQKVRETSQRLRGQSA